MLDRATGRAAGGAAFDIEPAILLAAMLIAWLGEGDGRELAKLGASVVAMFAGAVLGAWLVRHSIAALLGCGVILSAGCAMLAYSLREPSASVRRDH